MKSLIDRSPVVIPWKDGSLSVPISGGCHIHYLNPEYPEPLSDYAIGTIVEADLKKLAGRIADAQRIVLVIEDTSRPTRLESLLREIISAIKIIRGRNGGVKIIVACGAHFGLVKSQLLQKTGPLSVPAFIHDCIDSRRLVKVGYSQSGLPLWFNQDVVDADLRLTISTVNIHPMAGYSGGGKILLPGVAGLETICGFHNLSPGKPGNIQNPMRQMIDEVLHHLPVAFSWQILSRPDGSIIRIYGGDISTAHCMAAAHLEKTIRIVVDHPVDMVLAGCRPFNQNLLGTFKALTGLPGVLKAGGKVVLFNEAWQGRGDHHWRNRPEVVKVERDRAARLFERFNVGLYSPQIRSEDFEELFPRNFQLLRTETELSGYLHLSSVQELAVIPHAPLNLLLSAADI